jgi:hypothetical protein
MEIRKPENENWVDFRRLREIELGIAKPPSKAEILIRTYSNGDSNSGGESSGTDWTISEELTMSKGSNSGLSGLDSDDYLKEILDDDERKSRSISRPKKSINRRSLLHSFERPARNIDKFVSDALGVSSTHFSQDGSCDSGLDLTDSCSLSLPRKGVKGREIGANIKTVSIQSSDDDTALTNQKREKNKSSRPRAKKTQLKDLGTRLRATSLDRNRFGTRSMSVFSTPDSDCRSSDGISSEIFHSELNDYRGGLHGGIRVKPKCRSEHFRKVLTRHDDLLKNFNRRQRETIQRVEYVFEKSTRQIETALIDMKIEMVCKRA